MVRSGSVAAVLLGLGLPLLCGASSQAGESPAKPTADSRPQVLYLHTEFLPYDKTHDPSLAHRLGRELIRQAILLAARDEMGLATCDETLDETPPNNAPIIHLLPVERPELTGKWKVKLIPYDKRKNAWEKTYEFTRTGALMYASMLPQLETDTRGDLVDALQAAGLRGHKPKSRDPLPPGEGIEQLLGKVDFVAQYGAVRAAHQAIAAHGETPEWLGVLVRGYGNLAMLTEHQWNSTSEVFTARAWLYAQRLAVSSGESDLALWHRAYASALGGAIHQALFDLKYLQQRGKNEDGSQDVDDTTSADPPWSKLIQPYCRCDRGAMKQVGEQDPVGKPWATRLWFELARSYQQPQWMYEGATEVRDICPTAYGVYADLVGFGDTLGLSAAGAAWGPKVFACCMPSSLSTVPDLPKSIQQMIAAEALKESVVDELPWDDRSLDMFSPLPMSLARQLRQETAQTAPADLSWSALAYLLEEEQFLQVVHNFCDVEETDERPLAADVDALWPLVKDHRYAPYVDSFRYRARQDLGTMQDVLKTLRIEDPRMIMVGMFRAAWYLKDANGDLIGESSYRRAMHNHTVPSIEAYFSPVVRERPPRKEISVTLLMDLFRTIAPYSRNTRYFEILSTKDPTIEQLKQWEGQAEDDWRALLYLAERYKVLEDMQGAARCAEKSFALVPTHDAALWLAHLYCDQGKLDKSEQILLNFLKTVDVGRVHPQAYEWLVFVYAQRGQWRKARPFALAYGRTLTPVSLWYASEICEGLAEWQESEQYLHTGAESYPNAYPAFLWYYWCRRTGRGDVKAAREIAKAYFSVLKSSMREDQINLGVYQLLEGDKQSALETWQQVLSSQPTFACTFLVAQLAREQGDERLRQKVLDTMDKARVERSISAEPEEVKIAAAGRAIMGLLRTGDATEQRLGRIDELIIKLKPLMRSQFAYSVGKELDALGKTVEAETYWRRSHVNFMFDLHFATLSGYELALRHGTSRPDDDELDTDELWPPLGTDENSD